MLLNFLSSFLCFSLFRFRCAFPFSFYFSADCPLKTMLASNALSFISALFEFGLHLSFFLISVSVSVSVFWFSVYTLIHNLQFAFLCIFCSINICIYFHNHIYIFLWRKYTHTLIKYGKLFSFFCFCKCKLYFVHN